MNKKGQQDLMELPKAQPLVALPHVLDTVVIFVLDQALDPLLVELLEGVPGRKSVKGGS